MYTPDSKDKKETILQGPMAKIYLNGNPKTYVIFCQDHLQSNSLIAIIKMVLRKFLFAKTFCSLTV